MAEDYQKDPELGFAAVAGMDPAANWLLRRVDRGFLPDEEVPIPFLLELEDEEAVRAFLALPPLNDEAGEPTPMPGDNGVEIGERHLGNGTLVLVDFEYVVPGHLLPVFASRKWFERLLRDEPVFERFRRARKSILLSTPKQLPDRYRRDFPDFRLPLWGLPRGKFVDPPECGWPDGTVVTAVIDDGLPFAHERLRDGDGGTRVHAFWDMGMFFDPPPLASGIGELTKAEIDPHLTPIAGSIDEDAIYLDERLLDFRDPKRKALAWRIAHGAGVVDLAAGYEPADDRRDRPVVAVQLPSQVVAETAGEWLDLYVGLALFYVFDRTRRLSETGAPLPVVVNFSFGNFAGPHDGSGFLERFIDLASANPASFGLQEIRIVLPAGNAHLSRCHAVVDLRETEAVEFDWIIQPADRTDSIVELWLPDDDGSRGRVEMTLTPPFAAPVSIFETTVGFLDVFDHNGVVVGGLHSGPGSGGRRLIRATVFPTERMQPAADAVASAGAWKLRFARSGAGVGPVAHAWVQRDNSLYGYPQAGRQSYFDHPRYVRFALNTRPIDDDEHPEQGLCPVTRESLMNAVATGAEVITAGGYLERTCAIADYSAGGPNVPPEAGSPPPVKPDVLMPSEGSTAHRGLLAAGSRSGGRAQQNGTSVAAPSLARFVVEEIASGNPANRAAIAQKAQDHDVCSSAHRPANRGGRGSLPLPDPLKVERFAK